MSSNRSRNTAKKSGGRSQASRGRKAAQPVLAESARNDILGVAVIVVAVALWFALVSPSVAPVTSAIHTALVLGFGVGAPLVPVALLLFGLTFFVGSDIPLSARAALGLSLIVCSVLAILSITYPRAEFSPSLVLIEPVLSDCGGYVGGGIAWLLLELVGRTIGLVVLVGIIVTGVVICGFSISGVVERMRGHAGALGEALAERRAAHAAEEVPAAAEDQPLRTRGRNSERQVPQATLLDENGEAVTTFIGARKTSVLKRDATKTTLLGENAQPDASAQGATTVLAGTSEPGSDRGAVPGFLEADQEQSQTKGKRKTSRKSGKDGSAADTSIVRPGDATEDFELPPLSILRSNPDEGVSTSKQELEATAQRLQGTIEEFGLTSKVVGWTSGPRVTTFKVKMGEGERVSKLTNLEDDIALSLASGSVRIFSPIPGTSLVGIEIPNRKSTNVVLGDVLPYVQGGPLDAAFGRDSEGKPIVVDIADLPHLLVAGTTGSGKSVMLNSIIMSILMRSTPEQVRFIMVDPKRVEFEAYSGLPHLYVPVVSDPKQAASALQWGVSEMERRLKIFQHYKVRDIKAYNATVKAGEFAEGEDPKHMPYFVVVIDELADLMMVAGKEVEASIVRIAQLGRAAGIHLIVATQRPDATIVTGLIKANIDNRIALSVDNGMNSRIIIDQNGAEKLLGHGDMLVKLRGRKPRRAQGCYVDDAEIKKAVRFIRDQVDEPDYHEEVLSAVVPGQAAGVSQAGSVSSDDDPLVWEAAQLVVDSHLGSTSALQRHLKVGYARAGRIMDMLEQKGIVGPPDGSKPREVLLDADGLEELRAAESEYREV